MGSEENRSLVTVPNPEPERRYTVTFRYSEFTALYPTTSEPVFATVSIRYVPGETCLDQVCGAHNAVHLL